MHRRHLGFSVADDILPGEPQVAVVGVGITIVPLGFKAVRRSAGLLLEGTISLKAKGLLVTCSGAQWGMSCLWLTSAWGDMWGTRPRSMLKLG